MITFLRIVFINLVVGLLIFLALGSAYALELGPAVLRTALLLDLLIVAPTSILSSVIIVRLLKVGRL